jgi:ATP-binding cassette subfamily F protein 1
VNKAYEKYEKQLKAAKSSGKNTKAQQEKILATAQRQAKKRGGKAGEPIDDAGASASNAPQKWSDYSVAFHFPEPTELPPPLMQLIDADFKYPGEATRAVRLCADCR